VKKELIKKRVRHYSTRRVLSLYPLISKERPCNKEVYKNLVFRSDKCKLWEALYSGQVLVKKNLNAFNVCLSRLE